MQYVRGNIFRGTLAFLRRRITPINRIMKMRKPKDDPYQTAVITKSLAAHAGYPQRGQDNPLRRRIGTVQERELDVIQSPHVVYRLEDSALGAGSYGVDYRYPLLDIRLLQFCLNLPTEQKFKHGIARRMIRLATIGVLPEMVRTRSDKSRATVPTVHIRMVRDKDALIVKLETSQKSTQLGTYANLNPLIEYLGLLEAETQPDAGINANTVMRAIQLGIWLENNDMPAS